MPRRRSGKPKAGQSKHRGVDRKEGKIKRWNKASDVPLDEEDQFHASRDKILLEGDDYGNDGENDGDEDEVFALKGIPGSSDEEDGGDGGDGPEDDEDLERIVEAKGKKKSKSRKGKETSPSPSPSADESEECTQSPCQETAKIREGKEEGRVPEGGLQGRRLRNRGQIRRREDWNLTRREECPPVATRPRPSISLSVFLPYYRNPTPPHAHRTPVF